MFNNYNGILNIYNNIPNNLYLTPMIYKLVKNTDNKDPIQWYLEPYEYKFKTPNKLYGNLYNNAVRIWNKFAKSEYGIGAVLIGEKGSGKTETAKVVCNIALKNNLPVILVSEVNYDDYLARFISNLKDVVILFDEFGKIFSHYSQDKMLTMFNNLNGYKKLYIITENNKLAISKYFEDRPGRAWYWIQFDRLEESVIREYCKDHNVDESFVEEFLSIYRKAAKFNFDQLKAIVEEHLDYPMLSVNDLISILNVVSLRNEIVYKIVKVYDIVNNTEYVIPNNSYMPRITKKGFIDEKSVYDIELVKSGDDPESKKTIYFAELRSSNIVSINNNTIPRTIVVSSSLSNNENNKINIILEEV